MISRLWLSRFGNGLQELVSKQTGKFIVLSLSLLLLALISWRSLNFQTYHRPFTDSGVFATVAHHLLCGKVLYTEVWDHKPPLIYVINMLPLFFGDGSQNAIVFFERCFAIAAIGTFFWIVYLAFKKPFLAFFIAVGFNFHFYQPQIIQGGNYTEEYASVLILLGILLILLTKNKWRIYNDILCVGAGCLFSCAVFTKEPFVFSSIPWFLYLLFLEEIPFRESLRKGFFFLGGAFLPAIAVVLVFLVWGNFMDWMDVISYNYQYAKLSHSSLPWSVQVGEHLQRLTKYIASQSTTFHLLFLLGLGSACFLPFVKQYRYFPWICLSAYGIEFAATMISGFEIGHYYLQNVGSYILVCACGGTFTLFLFDHFHWRKIWLGMLFFLSLFLFDAESCKDYLWRLTVPNSQAEVGVLSQWLLDKKQEGDRLWANVGENSKYCVETKLLSPTKYFYVFEHHFLDTALSTREEKKDLLAQQLHSNPPEFLILSQEDENRIRKMGFQPLMDWVQTSYVKIYDVSENGHFIYVFRDRYSSW